MKRTTTSTPATTAKLESDAPIPSDQPSKRRRRKVDAADATAAAAASPAAETTPRRSRRTSASKKAEPPANDDKPSTTATAAAPDTAGPIPPSSTDAAPSQAAGEEPAPKPAAQRSRKSKPKPEPLPVYSPEMRPPRWEGPAFRILSWNVAGLRAVLKKDPEVFPRLAQQEAADVICVQETKIQECHGDGLKAAIKLPGWHVTWCCSTAKAGYSGTALFSKSKPLSVQCGMGLPDHDDEGRVVTAEYPDLYLVNVYTPNSSEGLKRLDYRVQQWDLAFRDHVKALEARGKPVVVTGDLNCAHQEVDIHNPKGNERSAGFTVEERDSFTKCYTENGLVDTWRAQHPGVTGFSYWTYKFNCRAKNKGWRLDYFLVSEGLMPRVHDSYMLQEVMGSDHCPLGLVIKPAAAS